MILTSVVADWKACDIEACCSIVRDCQSMGDEIGMMDSIEIKLSSKCENTRVAPFEAGGAPESKY